MKRPILVIDLETTGTKPHRDQIHGIGGSWAPGYEYLTGDKMQQAAADLANPDIDKLGANLTFDVRFLEAHGFKVNGRLWDTRLVAHLLDENSSTGLKELTKRYLGEDRLSGKGELDQLIEATGSGHVGNLCAKDLLDPSRPYTEVIGKYCLEDVRNTWDLWQVLTKKLKEKHEAMKRIFPGQKTVLDYYLEVAAPFEVAQMKLELPGVRVDLNRVETRKGELREKFQAVTSELAQLCGDKQARVETFFAERALAKKLSTLKDGGPTQQAYKEKGAAAFHSPFNWNKGGQVQRLFFTEMKLPTRHLVHNKQGVSLKEENIQALRNVCVSDKKALAVLDKYLELKETEKLLNTYIGAPGKKGLLGHIYTKPEGTFVYPEYNVYIKTDRLSCSNPNIQQLPRGSGIKRFFVPHNPDNVFLHFDASQVELRIAAHLSRDAEMIRAYHGGRDLHIMTASEMFQKVEEDVTPDERQVGKPTNFLMIFDGKAPRLQAQLLEATGRKFSLDECTAFIDAFFRKYPGIREFHKRILETVERRHLVVSETGRVRRLPDIIWGQWLDRKNRRFTGPKDYLRALQAEIDSGKKLPDPVWDAPERDRPYVLASLKYGHAKKQAYNFPIQHLGAVMTKRAIIRLQDAGHVVRSTVHDSIDVEIPIARLSEAPKIKQMIEAVYPLRVPVCWDMKVLRSFDEADKYEGK